MKKKTIYIFIIVMMMPIFSLALNYYVSPSGNNMNDGSIANPWRDINYAINTAIVVGGDTIIVGEGSYTESGTITMNKSIMMVGAGTTSTIINSTGTTPAITVSANNVSISNLGITNITQLVEGIRVSGASSGLVITNIHFTNLGNNPGPGNAFGIQIMNSFSNLSVNGCEFVATNLGVYSRAFGIYAPAGSQMSNFRVENSLFKYFFTGVDIRCEIDGLVVTNNTFGPQETADCTAAVAGIYMGDGPNNNYDLKNIEITYNTFTAFGRGVYVLHYAKGEIIGKFDIKNNTFVNSIYSSPVRLMNDWGATTADTGSLEGPVTIDNNVFNQVNAITGGTGVAMIDIRKYVESTTSQLFITKNQFTFTGPFSVPTFGVFLRGPITDASISGNIFKGNNAGGAAAGYPPTSGIYIKSNDSYWGTISSTARVKINLNELSGYVNAISVFSTVFGGLPMGSRVMINANNIEGNSNGVVSGDGEIVNAVNNWWGSSSGPAPTGSGDSVSTNVIYDPWSTNTVGMVEHSITSETTVINFEEGKLDMDFSGGSIGSGGSIIVGLSYSYPTGDTPGADFSSANALRKVWVITSNLTGFTTDLVFYYEDADIPAGVNEANLMPMRSTDGGLTWQDVTGTVTRDTVANWIKVAGVTGFSMWAFGDNSMVPVELSDFRME